MKRVAEIVEGCREADINQYSTIDMIRREFSIRFEEAEELYNRYVSTHLGSVNHELFGDEGC